VPSTRLKALDVHLMPSGAVTRILGVLKHLRGPPRGHSLMPRFGDISAADCESTATHLRRPGRFISEVNDLVGTETWQQRALTVMQKQAFSSHEKR